MKSLFVVLLICSVLFLSACHLKDYKSNKTVLEITEIAEEQQIPKAILQQLDEELKEEFKTTPPLYSFMPINVAFLQKQEEVLAPPQRPQSDDPVDKIAYLEKLAEYQSKVIGKISQFKSTAICVAIFKASLFSSCGGSSSISTKQEFSL
jgi:hypothetical protein